VVVKRALIGGLVLGLMGSCAAFAQQAQQAPVGKPDVKTVEDWMVRCYPVQSVSPCDIFQEQDDQKGQRVMSISLAFVPSMNRHIIQVTVPLDVAIPNGITMQSDTYTSPVLKYRMCTREGCFVQTAVGNDIVEALAKSSGQGKVNVFAMDGKKYALTFSLKGFSAAHDDMVSQAKAKAKPADAAAPPAKP
jgi:invasion protein IalB